MRHDVKSLKAEAFSLRIIQLVKWLDSVKHERVMGKQILRSATSIGANIVEADYAESKSDFIHKLTISQKEAAETLYWLRLLGKSQIITADMFVSLYADAEELMKIISSILIKVKSNQ